MTSGPAPGPDPTIPDAPVCIVLTGNESIAFLNELKEKGFVIKRESSAGSSQLRGAAGGAKPLATGDRILACRERARFGHSKECRLATLSGKVWPGHAKATEFADAGIRALMNRPDDPEVRSHFRDFFSNRAIASTPFKEILDRFLELRAALDDEFLYHCKDKGDKMGGHRCGKGLFARTDDDSPFDIELCVPSIGPYTVDGMGALLLHEHVHRLGLFDPPEPAHDAEFRNFGTGECPDRAGLNRFPRILSKNCDSFACFGAWAKKAGF